MNKKASLFFLPILVIIALVVLISLYLILLSKSSPFVDTPIGKRQFELLNTYIKAESALFYIDQSAKYSAEQAIYDLAKNGGFAEIEEDEVDELESIKKNLLQTKCGRYSGYAIWYEIKENNAKLVAESCFQEKSLNINLQNNLIALFNDNLNNYFFNYPDNLPINNYNYQIRDSLEITGVAVSPIYFNIMKDFEVSEYDKEGITSKLQVEPTTTTPSIKVSYKYKLKAPPRPKDVVVDRIVLHHTGGDTASEAYQTLKDRMLSVHYIIDRDGTIYYLVDERKMALHAKGWNVRSIGIEIVNTGYANMEYTDAQYGSIKSLINDIASRWPSINTDNEHIIAHYEISTDKWDPSPNFEWAKIGLPQHITLSTERGKVLQKFGYI